MREREPRPIRSHEAAELHKEHLPVLADHPRRFIPVQAPPCAVTPEDKKHGHFVDLHSRFTHEKQLMRSHFLNTSIKCFEG